MRCLRVWGVLGALLLLLAACSNATPTPAATAVPGAPTPAAANATAGAEATLPPAVVQTPASDQVGTITGQIYRQASKTPAGPLAGAPLYLGTILTNPQGENRVVELEKGTAPKTNADSQGRFVFTNIPPGRYGLMLDAPFGTLLLNDPKTGGDLIVEVVGGKVVDLGQLEYPLDY